MDKNNDTTADAGGVMPVIAEKSGQAIVSLRLVSSRRLQQLVPEPLVVHSVLPGLALYAVGAFLYSEIRVGHERGSTRSWCGVSDAAIIIPVLGPNDSVAWFLPRLYNTCPEVIEWAAGQRLPKIEAGIDWRQKGRQICVRVARPTGSGERLEIHGRQRFGLPEWIWKLGPLRAVARSTLLVNDNGSIRRFAYVFKSIGRASYCSVSCVADGIAMPTPWLSFGCVLSGFAGFVIEAGQPI